MKKFEMIAIILLLEEDADLSTEPENIVTNPHKALMVNLIKLMRESQNSLNFLPIIQNLDWNEEEEM